MLGLACSCNTNNVIVDNTYTELLPNHKLAKYTDEKVIPPRITTTHPLLSWTISANGNNIRQVSFRVMVASDKNLLEKGKADLWDTGWIADSVQAINYQGKTLASNSKYFWTVKIETNAGEISDWSRITKFYTSNEFSEETAVLPLEKETQRPVAIYGNLIDFGTDDYAQLHIKLKSDVNSDSVIIYFGEQRAGNAVNKEPIGSKIADKYVIYLEKGSKIYDVRFRKNPYNTDPEYNGGAQPILMPSNVGEVLPFRYVEIENYKHKLKTKDISRDVIHYAFDEKASDFECSDTVLNAVWNLCKHTAKATSFCGTYVDGNRERIPYEADILINQLTHYAVDCEYSMARHTLEYIVQNPTWPTEWILQTLIIAWNDYMYTGDCRMLYRYYDDLKYKTLFQIRDRDGLIATGNNITDSLVLRSIHSKRKEIRDIVDWPRSGDFDWGKDSYMIDTTDFGEDDNFEYLLYNAVVNSYHYNALSIMANIAKVVNNNEDAQGFQSMANLTLQSFNQKFRNSATQTYVDGIGSGHSSLHSNMFPMLFGMVDSSNIKQVVNFVKSRGMKCSVYGAQFLLDALYNAGEGDYALSLLADTSKRSWYNMIKTGSTITTEAWDDSYKPNQDWNHAWGSAAGNVIARKMMGIEPLEPGFSKIKIRPQIGSLDYARIKMPTIKGEVRLNISRKDGRIVYSLDIPANTEAVVILPSNKKVVELSSGHHVVEE